MQQESLFNHDQDPSNNDLFQGVLTLFDPIDIIHNPYTNNHVENVSTSPNELEDISQ
jgi:hypothetical protein